MKFQIPLLLAHSVNFMHCLYISRMVQSRKMKVHSSSQTLACFSCNHQTKPQAYVLTKCIFTCTETWQGLICTQVNFIYLKNKNLNILNNRHAILSLCFLSLSLSLSLFQLIFQTFTKVGFQLGKFQCRVKFI